MRKRVYRIRALFAGDFRFFQDFWVLTVGQLASRVMGFLAFAWIARTLDPAAYGAVEYVVGISIFFATLADGGLGVIGTRRAAQKPDDLALLAFQIPLARLLIVLVGLPVMAYMATHVLGTQAPAAIVWLFAASVVAAPFRQQWLFQATERMSFASWGDAIRMGVFGIAVWLLVRDRGDLMQVGYAEVLSVAGVTLYSVLVQHFYVTPVRLRGKMTGFRTLMREGLTVGSTNLVWALNQYLPLFLIAWFLGGEQIAWFAGASRIVVSLIQFSNLYHFNMYPAVAKAYVSRDGSLGPLLARSTRVIGWAGLGCATMLVVLDQHIVYATLGPKLLQAAPLLDIMAWMLPIALVSGHARWSLAAAGAQLNVLMSQIAGVAATLVGLLILGPMLGPAGYAVASVAGFLVVWAVSHWFAVQRDCAPPSPFILLRPVLLSAAVIAGTHLVGEGLWARIGLLVLAAAVAPLIDRKLLPDIAMLARTRGAVARPEI